MYLCKLQLLAVYEKESLNEWIEASDSSEELLEHTVRVNSKHGDTFYGEAIYIIDKVLRIILAKEEMERVYSLLYRDGVFYFQVSEYG